MPEEKEAIFGLRKWFNCAILALFLHTIRDYHNTVNKISRSLDPDRKISNKENDLHANNYAFHWEHSAILLIMVFMNHEKCIRAHLITLCEPLRSSIEFNQNGKMHATNWKWMEHIVAKVLNFEWLLPFYGNEINETEEQKKNYTT